MPTLLIFGARNLGRAIAGHMAELGWSVAAVARSEETVGRLRDELPDALGIAGDAASEEDVERAFDEARVRFGSVDLVVVAISPTFRGRQFGGGKLAAADGTALGPYTEELLPALFTVLRVGARRLKEQGVGTFVQITGGSARRGMPGRGPWAAAAFATRALVQSAAGELREHGIHVALLIVDATIESEKSADRLAGRAPEESASQKDVARAIAYLAGQSPRAWTHELQLTPSGDLGSLVANSQPRYRSRLAGAMAEWLLTPSVTGAAYWTRTRATRRRRPARTTPGMGILGPDRFSRGLLGRHVCP